MQSSCSGRCAGALQTRELEAWCAGEAVGLVGAELRSLVDLAPRGVGEEGVNGFEALACRRDLRALRSVCPRERFDVDLPDELGAGKAFHLLVRNAMGLLDPRGCLIARGDWLSAECMAHWRAASRQPRF